MEVVHGEDTWVFPRCKAISLPPTSVEENNFAKACESNIPLETFEAKSTDIILEECNERILQQPDTFLEQYSVQHDCLGIEEFPCTCIYFLSINYTSFISIYFLSQFSPQPQGLELSFSRLSIHSIIDCPSLSLTVSIY